MNNINQLHFDEVLIVLPNERYQYIIQLDD